MRTQTFDLHTGSKPVVADITRQCGQFAREASGGGDGLLQVFVLHRAPGHVRGADQVQADGLLPDLLPADDHWRHAHGSRGHGRSHVLPAFVPPSVTVPVISGRLGLGTWQSIAIVDLNADNPHRQIRLSFLG
jgi:thiamine phosphate synthase YjbQ (UPF0047 family)